MPRYIGLEVHKNYIHSCEFLPGQPEGKQERHFRFPNTSQGWSAFIGQFDPDTRVALEVTGNAFEIYDTLFPHAGQVFVANALELKRMGSGRHTDRADASRLARMLALGALPTVWVPPQTMRQVRQLLRARERLNRSRLALLNQARSVLSRHGVTVPKGADLFRLLTPHELVRLPTGEKAIVLANFEGARSLSQQVDALTVEIAQNVAHIPEVKQLLTIPGVGKRRGRQPTTIREPLERSTGGKSRRLERDGQSLPLPESSSLSLGGSCLQENRTVPKRQMR